MYSLPTSPKSIGGVLDDIFKLFPSALATTWPIAIVASIVISLPGLFLATKANATPEEMLAAILDPSFWGLYLIAIVLAMVLYAALVKRVDAVANERDSSFADAIASAFGLAPRLIGAGLLYTLAVMAGMILLIVPGIILSISMMLYSVCIVIEDAGAVDSLSRSRQLVKGAWWRTVTILTVALIVAYLLIFCVQFAVGFMIGFGDQTGFNLVSTLVGAVMYVVVYPFLVAMTVCIYYDLKLRKEGDDLTQRVASLAKA